MPAMPPATFSGIPQIDRPSSATHGVYTLSATTGELVYVGVSRSPRNRIVFHRSHAAWWPDDGKVLIQVEWFADATAAGLREMEMIRLHQPAGNSAGVKYPCAPFRG